MALPTCLKPLGPVDLIRLGRGSDGGYLVERRSVMEAKRLVSGGLGFDWSFERDFLKLNDVPLDMYDHTVTARTMWKKTLGLACPFTTLNNLRNAVPMGHYVSLPYAYRAFFRGDRKHHRTGIGNERLGMLSVGTLIERCSEDFIFLKMDIEGAEYQVLEDVIAYAGRLSGLVMEIHDYPIHKIEIAKFIDEFPLSLAHIHANNNGGVDIDGNPVVFELTFSRYGPVQPGPVSLPHPADRIGDRSRVDIPLVFEDGGPQERPHQESSSP